MLRFDQLSKTYADGTQALSAITLGVGRGEIVALLGGSGCGKTTLLRLVAGLDKPSAGQVGAHSSMPAMFSAMPTTAQDRVATAPANR